MILINKSLIYQIVIIIIQGIIRTLSYFINITFYVFLFTRSKF